MKDHKGRRVTEVPQSNTSPLGSITIPHAVVSEAEIPIFDFNSTQSQVGIQCEENILPFDDLSWNDPCTATSAMAANFHTTPDFHSPHENLHTHNLHPSNTNVTTYQVMEFPNAPPHPKDPSTNSLMRRTENHHDLDGTSKPAVYIEQYKELEIGIPQDLAFHTEMLTKGQRILIDRTVVSEATNLEAIFSPCNVPGHSLVIFNTPPVPRELITIHFYVLSLAEKGGLVVGGVGVASFGVLFQLDIPLINDVEKFPHEFYRIYENILSK